MEFWGVEVKSGKPLKVVPKDEFVIYLSQATLGEFKKDKNEPVMLFAKVDEEKIVLGTLSSDKCLQIPLDVIFEKEFELSHNSKSQAALGEFKNKNEPVMLFVKVGEQKIVLGTLSSDKFPQIPMDLVFENEFELSHNSKNAVVHFCGYQSLRKRS